MKKIKKSIMTVSLFNNAVEHWHKSAFLTNYLGHGQIIYNNIIPFFIALNVSLLQAIGLYNTKIMNTDILKNYVITNNIFWNNIF